MVGVEGDSDEERGVEGRGFEQVDRRWRDQREGGQEVCGLEVRVWVRHMRGVGEGGGTEGLRAGRCRESGHDVDGTVDQGRFNELGWGRGFEYVGGRD